MHWHTSGDLWNTSLPLVGHCTHLLCIAQVVALCWMTIIAYTVLAGSMLTEVLRATGTWSGHPSPPWANPKLSMVAISVAVFPRCIATTLTNLRVTSMLSVASILVLAVVVGVRSLQRLATPPVSPAEPLEVWPGSWEGIPYSLPLYSAAFVCHFNVLPMHTELKRPTRARVRRVLHITVAVCTGIYAAIGTLGYLYDRARTCDNIMSNFCETDALATVGRVALVLVIFFNLPLIVIPCRTYLLRLCATCAPASDASPPPIPEFTTDPAMPLPDSPAAPREPELGLLGRSAATGGIQATACGIACYVPGVSAVWTILGSTVCMSVAFIMPCAFYLKLRRDTPCNVRKAAAAGLLGVAGLAAALSTYEAVAHVVSGRAASCPAGFNPCA